MTWTGTPVLVSGAGGFIGSHLVEQLARAGARVRAFVHYNALGSWGWLDQSESRSLVEVVSGDLRDGDTVRRAMDGVEVVFHLGALVGIPYSYHAPRSYVDTNVVGTLNVLTCARDAGVRRLVHTSTSEVYGTARRVPIDEEHPLQAQSPYAASKVAADKLAEAFHLSFDVPVTTVRPFNTYGPRQSARAVIPTIITQCLRGSVVRLGHLRPTRDFNYVEDTVEGFLLAAATPGAAGQTFNLGSGKEISIGSLATVIGGLLGRTLSIESDERRERPDGSEVERLVADSTRAHDVLGWRPAVTLEDGLRRTISWIEQHQERYRDSVYAI